LWRRHPACDLQPAFILPATGMWQARCLPFNLTAGKMPTPQCWQAGSLPYKDGQEGRQVAAGRMPHSTDAGRSRSKGGVTEVLDYPSGTKSTGSCELPSTTTRYENTSASASTTNDPAGSGCRSKSAPNKVESDHCRIERAGTSL